MTEPTTTHNGVVVRRGEEAILPIPGCHCVDCVHARAHEPAPHSAVDECFAAIEKLRQEIDATRAILEGIKRDLGGDE